MKWLYWTGALSCLAMFGLSIYMMSSCAGVFNTLRAASPAIEAYTGYLMGVMLLAATTGMWAIILHSDDQDRLYDLEARIEYLEKEWSEADLGDEEDEIGYA